MSSKIQTIILPGYSEKNKAWAEGIKAELEPEIPITVTYWPHWSGEEGKDGWITQEADKILQQIKDQVNIISKSVGTLVAAQIVDTDSTKVDKLILCGIPIKNISQEDRDSYKTLQKLLPEKVLVIQNENDHTGSYEQVVAFIQAINPSIRVISKPRDDHEYPYQEDFKEFLINLTFSKK